MYILTNNKHKPFYTGVTNSLIRRVWEHKNNVNNGFTSRYNLHKLVYYKSYEDIEEAIHREKIIKKWKRQWKINLIEIDNPGWEDLYDFL